MEAAVDSDVEVRRARRTLRKHDDETTLREVLRERLEVV
jgi:hypothetical protein